MVHIEHDTTDDDDLDPDANEKVKIEFNESDDTKPFTVTIIGDNNSENDETYYMELTDENGVTIDDGGGKGTINDDDSGWFSDKRLKTDIKPLENSLQHIEQINGVKFYWKDKKRFGSQKEIGVIAQDVEKVYPQIVTTDKDGYKKVNYQLLVAPLIEAVKELKKENEQLKQRVEKLENR